MSKIIVRKIRLDESLSKYHISDIYNARDIKSSVETTGQEVDIKLLITLPDTNKINMVITSKSGMYIYTGTPSEILKVLVKDLVRLDTVEEFIKKFGTDDDIEIYEFLKREMNKSNQSKYRFFIA